ncbi:MAG TPA: serine/threonine-protein kinase, partial [Planctomycetota bacterium]|nr:serine/threonine-protein kinase [Planctomycetota bacterium]
MLQKILGTVMRLSLLTTVFALALLWFGGNHLEQLYGWPSRSQIVTSCGAIIVAHAVLAIRAAMRARTRAQAIEPEVRAEPRVQAIVAPPPIPQDRPRDEPPIAAKAPPLAAHPDPLGNPQQIGSYRILDLLGEGGMGTVYLAEQREPIRRRVAIKVIKLGMDTKEVLRRFEAERQALAMLDHDNVARMLDAGATTEGRPWFAMELVAGISITEYCDQNRLPVHDRLALFCQVCSGIQHVHGRGILHRDLKPSNVLVADRDGHRVAKIIDFGLARAMNHRLIAQTLFTEQGVIIGTPEYMSPEQAGISGLDVDHRSDVYSLGALLYELLVGEPPFAGLRSKGLLELQRCVRE